MKSVLKKMLSVVLSLVIAFSALLLGVQTNAADPTPGTDIPLIYVEGQGEPLYIYEGGSRRKVYPITVPEGFIQSAVKENIGIFAKAVITQKWTDFGNVLSDIMYTLFGEIALDENGNSLNGVRINWDPATVKINTKKVDGKYPAKNFLFHYDWRLDPYENAEKLHTYVERVCEATGHDKVAMLGRCLGACVVSAYMEKYDGEHVSDLILYASAFNGATQVSKLFAGELYLDADSIDRFMYDLNLSEDAITNELIRSFVSLFNKTYGLDLTCAAVNNVMPDIYLDIMPQVLVDTLGTWPGFWSMVNDRDYNKAKDNVFHNADMDKYAPFVEMIDNYHYNVQVESEENFKNYAERGIEISNITKFGYQTVPVTDDGDMISDSICWVTDASMGATAATLSTELSGDYLANLEAQGKLKYVSPDNKIDASTCLFPNTTWFIGNLGHKDFPEKINSLFDSIVNNDDFTVDSDEKYPQYMMWDGNELSPMTAENSNATDRYHHTFIEVLKNLFKKLTMLIKNLIKNQFVKEIPA